MKNREHNIITSLDLDPVKQENLVKGLQTKYREIEKAETRYETFMCEDADVVLVAYGSTARICQKCVDVLRAEGIKVGLLRPITLFPFPSEPINKLADKAKHIVSVEMSAGQMVEDVRLAVNGKREVGFYGRVGGIIPTPEEIVDFVKTLK